MVTIERAAACDAVALTEIQARTFRDDNQWKPAGCSMEAPPGYDSVDWNAKRIEEAPYYKTLLDDRMLGGIIIYDAGEDRFELGRIYADPDLRGQGMGRQAVRLLLAQHPAVERWTLGTPAWAVRSHHLYEKLGFVRIRETEVNPALGWSGYEYVKVCVNPADMQNQ